MDKTSFSAELNRAKEKSGLTFFELALKTSTQTQTLHNVASGKKNVFMQTVFVFLNALNHRIFLKRATDDAIFRIQDENTLLQWAKITFEQSGLSRSSFAGLLGISRNSFPLNLSGETKMRIDTFLKWAEITGWSVELQPM